MSLANGPRRRCARENAIYIYTYMHVVRMYLPPWAGGLSCLLRSSRIYTARYHFVFVVIIIIIFIILRSPGCSSSRYSERSVFFVFFPYGPETLSHPFPSDSCDPLRVWYFFFYFEVCVHKYKFVFSPINSISVFVTKKKS